MTVVYAFLFSMFTYISSFASGIFDLPSSQLSSTESIPKYYNSALIVVLDKVLGRRQVLSITKSQIYMIGDLEVSIKNCWKSNDPYRPRIWAFLEITEQKEDQINKIFYSWISANSHSLNPLRHSIYTILLLDCLD